MASISQPSQLANPLATVAKLETTASQLQGIPQDIEHFARFDAARLTQAAGILLRLPQEIIAQSIIVLQRFYVGADGGSWLEQDLLNSSAASLYLCAKPSETPVSARQILTVLSYLESTNGDFSRAAQSDGDFSPADWHITQGQYEVKRDQLYLAESDILRVLGFQTHVALPYTLCINYLQTLEVFSGLEGSALAKRAFAHLNSALLSPQLLCLTHQPSAIATAAIYLAAREVDAKLPEVEWWEVFDVDREELGFLVVALLSLEGFALERQEAFGGKAALLTQERLRLVLEAGVANGVSAS
ncbi:cyclin [Hortaea werneckii]|uniref:Cyclin N-terminal domain-containing protein n=1 Tax=Hortaea werneckii TaxID=91943 RepID=A0A3M7F1I6_HORWE|nr:cyclin [Hortaea werneckii]KAI6882583.1 cyclin [Hortaea werneckii]KAI6991488.1 cyclin [Hortaea werneckii]KAI7144199.1 cyclin [Hortaea werneckii]KAI7172209.1 cyclin [Hortaea werneckii]